MTAVGLVRDARHRYSWNGGPLYPSVTTILAIKDKPALVGWAKRETAACAVRNLDVLARMVQSGGAGAAIEWLKRIPDYHRDVSADLGTAVHAAAEAIARGEPVAISDEVRPFVAAYRRDFLEVFTPRFLAIEAMVCSERYEYGGTADAFVEIDGEIWLLDYKSGSRGLPRFRPPAGRPRPGPVHRFPRRPDPVPGAGRHPLRGAPYPARGGAPAAGRRRSGDGSGLPRCSPPLWVGPGPGQDVIGEPIVRAAKRAAA